MIESRENVQLVVERHIEDAREARAEATAIKNGLKPHPLTGETATSSPSASPTLTTSQIFTRIQPSSPQENPPQTSTETQPAQPLPPDPQAPTRHLRLGITAALLLILLLLWLWQRK